MATFYDYSVPTVEGTEKSMKDFEGKVVVVVNTATGCGFTPHYEPIEKLYEAHHADGLEIVDVPCNQFAGQAPESDEEIHEFCQLKYNTQFPQMKKFDKNYKDNPDIKWNFTKFVIDRNGNVVRGFEPTESMDEFTKYVESLL